MALVNQALAAIVLVGLTLVLQSAGIAALVQWARLHLARFLGQPGRMSSGLLVIRLMSLIVCLHLLEILLWAAFYRRVCFPTWESAFYFSATSYSTIGSEELVLRQAWRLLGPIESLLGVLMCAVSASFLFAVVTRLVERRGHSEVIQ